MRVTELNMDDVRICNFLHITSNEIEHMYNEASCDSEILLKWSKLLEYDFFRLYSQHLILYSPSASIKQFKISHKKHISTEFRKNIYTKEVIDFILELIESGGKSKKQVIEDYKIPKTTLYKWINKYGQEY